MVVCAGAWSCVWEHGRVCVRMCGRVCMIVCGCVCMVVYTDSGRACTCMLCALSVLCISLCVRVGEAAVYPNLARMFVSAIDCR
jgi:nitrate/nitrite transporter NarK